MSTLYLPASEHGYPNIGSDVDWRSCGSAPEAHSKLTVGAMAAHGSRGTSARWLKYAWMAELHGTYTCWADETALIGQAIDHQA